MATRITVRDYDDVEHAVVLNGLDRVDQCPICHQKIQPKWNHAQLIQDYSILPARYVCYVFQCPNRVCRKLFFGKFTYNVGTREFNFDGSLEPVKLKKREFSEHLNTLSAQFEQIYNDSLAAETFGLAHVCGPGFRKALEFLVKDYCKHKNPEQGEKINKAGLAAVIKEFIVDKRIKNLAEKTAWLGNDQTHYIKIWEDHDLEDLKTLLDLTILFIEGDIMYERRMEEMQKPPQK